MVAALLLHAGTDAASAQTDAINIEKSTNGVDADSSPGPILSPGEAVTWDYEISVTGPTTLYDLIVSDTSGISPNCDIDGDGSVDGTHIHPGPLNPGQSFHCIASGTAHDAANGVFSSVGKVRAFDFDGAIRFEDQDASHYTPLKPFTAKPGVSIQSLVNGVDADASPGPYIAEGSAVTWTYVVTNSGNVPLTAIAVGNNAGLAVDCGTGSSIAPGPLAPGASVTCTSSGAAPASSAGLQANLGSVQASAIDPTTGGALTTLGDDDPMNYTPVQLPARLAFTGASTTYALAGGILMLLGIGLLLSVNSSGRRRPLPAVATTSVDRAT